MKRPTSITVISWILIVMSALGFIGSAFSMINPEAREMMAKNPIPIPVQIGMLFGGLIITIVCGVAMLSGHNWGRWLYVIWSVFGMVVSLATSPMKLMIIPSLLVFLIITFFLFRPNASLYFTQTGVSDEEGV